MLPPREVTKRRMTVCQETRLKDPESPIQLGSHMRYGQKGKRHEHLLRGAMALWFAQLTNAQASWSSVKRRSSW